MGNPGVQPIVDVAERLDIPSEHLIPYGTDKAKVRRPAGQATAPPRGRLILVTAITPTTAGEGKTTTSISLAQGLGAIGERACLALREPSLGPIFGMKGGAIGGGRSLMVPGEDINLHFTGDFHAISCANNLLAALLDNHLHHGNALGIDVRRVLWRRVVDLNDRALREVMVGLGGPAQGMPRQTGFDITPASEVMAALCLAEDAKDLRARLGRILVALTAGKEKRPVTAADLEAVGAMMVVLKDALHPNLVQTCEGVPAFVHGGPFANIAHGCNSVIATKAALAHADWAITEAGFAFDLGGEKFFDIKCKSAGLRPAAVVLVATVRALKRHGGVPHRELGTTDPAAVERGLDNLRKHVENIRLFTDKPVVTLNQFDGDTDDEIAAVRRACEEMGVPFALCDGFARGGEGGAELARTVIAHAAAEPAAPRGPYAADDPLETKLEKLATAVYGAGSVAWTTEAKRDLKLIRKLGYGELPLCVAKTQMSLSDNPSLVNRPQGFEATVRGMVLSAGAGFVVPLLGSIMRMPGLRARPQSAVMDLVDGRVVGMH